MFECQLSNVPTPSRQRTIPLPKNYHMQATMMGLVFWAVVVSSNLASAAGSYSSPGGVGARLDVDWSAFLGRSDLMYSWNTSLSLTPDKWYDSAFLGNGALGLMIRAVDGSSDGSSDATTASHSNSASRVAMLRLDLGRTDIYDDRVNPNQHTPGHAEGNFACDRPRLPIGYFLLSFTHEVVSFTQRLVLWDATAIGKVRTEGGGKCEYAAFAAADYALADVLQLSLNCSGGEEAVLAWVPQPAVSTWAQQCKPYVYNPDPTTSVQGGIATTTQMHLSGTSHAAAFGATPPLPITSAGGMYAAAATAGPTTFHITVAPVSTSANTTARSSIAVAQAAGADAMTAAHLRWWHEYYPASFLTFSASRLESFYWIQMYKLASATRGDRVVYDLMGPWYIDGTNWPDLHWDLNVQLTYWPVTLAPHYIPAAAHILASHSCTALHPCTCHHADPSVYENQC